MPTAPFLTILYQMRKLEWQLYVNYILKMFFNVDPLNQLCCTFLLQPLDPPNVSYQISPKYVQLQQVGAIPTSLHTCTPRLPLSGLSWCTIARCTPGLLVPLNNVYAKQVRFLLTDLQNRMFHRAQLHCLLWWLPAICSGVFASIELHKIWKMHFSSWNMDLSGLWKGTQYVLLKCEIIDCWCCHSGWKCTGFELYRHVGGLLVHAWTGL